MPLTLMQKALIAIKFISQKNGAGALRRASFVACKAPPVTVTLPLNPPVLRRAAGAGAAALVAAGALLAAPAPAAAASAVVEVRGAGGTPLVGAVVLLESDAARRQARPATGLEMGPQDRAFQPGRLVAP